VGYALQSYPVLQVKLYRQVNFDIETSVLSS
jgi:hypothetical protein